MTNSPTQNSMIHNADVLLKPVTDATEIPALVDLFMKAIEPDPFLQWLDLFVGKDERQSTLTVLNNALTDPNYSIIKAVLPPQTPNREEVLVGFAHWLCGYIMLDKVDPFAPSKEVENLEANESNDIADATSNVAEEIAREVEDLHSQSPAVAKTKEDEEKARRLEFGKSVLVDMGNHYIMSIRGKKHIYIRRMMVHPDYQRRGIASKLLKHVTDQADEKKIVCWLYSRPVAESLYRKFGFVKIHATEMDFGDYKCPPATGMLRSPVPVVGPSE